MFVSESWLRSYINPPIDTERLCHKLTMAGLEVEESKAAAAPFSEVVVAEITHIEAHPNADRLRVCTVNDGQNEYQIVCGAPNARAGLKAPLAKIGAVLPGDFRIKPVKMRGVESQGMLCSAQELGISEDAEGLLELSAEAPLGQCLRNLLDLDDQIIEIKMTPNRADCLSIIGVAREVKALTDEPLNLPSFEPVTVGHDDILPVRVQDKDLCGRFAGRIIRGVNAAAPTPQWMVNRLARAGQRSISALVDISNYVMLELGRPTHVFDLDKLGSELEVRWAQEGEQLVLLNEQEVALNPYFGVICSDGQPESLAGIMGGARTAVNDQTTNIYVEAAFWWPEAIMGRARSFKFQSEASYRFERGVDAESIVPHLEYVTRLILEICGGSAGPIDDQELSVPTPQPVRMRHERCEKILGISLTKEEVLKVFQDLNFSCEYQAGVYTVVAPTYRFDIAIEEDLIEEVARIIGFDRIPDELPWAQTTINVRPEDELGVHELRDRVAALDYQEVINFSFVDESWETRLCGNQNPIRLLNPIASQLSVMRSSLIGGLLKNIQYNARHRQSRVRIFEIGRVFWRDDDVKDGPLSVAGVNQPQRLAVAAWGTAAAEQWGLTAKRVDFYDLKADLEALFGQRAKLLRFEAAKHPSLHPGRCARILLEDQEIGIIGELHPQCTQDFDLPHAPVVFELELEALLQQPVFTPSALISRQPVVQRDLAFWLPTQVSYQQVCDSLEHQIRQHPGLSVVQAFLLFDIWKDETHTDEQSFAMRFWLQDSQKTLADHEVEECMNLLFNALQTQFHARLRS